MAHRTAAICRAGCSDVGGGGGIAPLGVIEAARPLDRLCKNDVGTRLTRAREERLAITGDDHDARAAARPSPKLANQHVARDIRQSEVAQHHVQRLLPDQLCRLPPVGCTPYVCALAPEEEREPLADDM